VWTGRYFDSLTFPSRGHGLGLELGGGITVDSDRSPFQRTVTCLTCTVAGTAGGSQPPAPPACSSPFASRLSPVSPGIY
jgi:hypothetical protein